MKIRRPIPVPAACFRRDLTSGMRTAFFFRRAKRRPIVDPVEAEYTQITKPEAMKRLENFNKTDR